MILECITFLNINNQLKKIGVYSIMLIKSYINRINNRSASLVFWQKKQCFYINSGKYVFSF